MNRACRSIGSCLAMLVPVLGSVEEPTYSSEIAPILYENCVECHRPGGSGPFSLFSFADAQRRARQIAEVVSDRYMPPWLPDSEYGPSLIGERSLDKGQIEMLQRWFEQGAPEGDPNLTPPPPRFQTGWTLGEPDLILELVEPYHLPFEGKDVYRNFVIPVKNAEPLFVESVEFQTESTTAIHHAILMSDTSGWARNEDEWDPLPGFDGMELSGASALSGNLFGWTPGQVPFQAYPQTAWELDPDSVLILQTHLLPTGKPEKVAPRIGLHFAQEAPARQTYSLILRDRHIDIPAGQADYFVEESIMLPVETQLIGLYPHAHYIATEMEIFATLPDGVKRGLLRIPQWDFNWQRDYRFEEPVSLPAGTRLTMRYSYDNSAANPRNPSDPPRRVKIGWNSEDEMGEVAIQLLLEKPEDQSALLEADARYRMEGMGKPLFYYQQAEGSEARGDLAGARAGYQRALREDPSFAAAMNKLGTLAERSGDLLEAFSWFRKAVVEEPDSIGRQLNLARVSHRLGDFSGAQQILESAIQMNPGSEDAVLLLASFLSQAGNTRAQIETLEAGLASVPQSTVLNLELAKLLFRMGRIEESRSRLEAAVEKDLKTLDSKTRRNLSAAQADAWVMCAMLDRQANREADVSRSVDAALNLSPRHRGALILKASILAEAGNVAEAEKTVIRMVTSRSMSSQDEEALLKVLPFVPGYRGIARARAERGDQEAARKLLQEGLSVAQERGEASAIESLQKLKGEYGW